MTLDSRVFPALGDAWIAFPEASAAVTKEYGCRHTPYRIEQSSLVLRGKSSAKWGAQCISALAYNTKRELLVCTRRYEGLDPTSTRG
eukprot:SAG11_NODE_6499_length_1295_cov_2.757903_1_plen_87_part_00